jgi:integrase
VTLRDYVVGEWWPNYAERRLALSTQESHSTDLDLRILPRLGDLALTRIRPAVVERFVADLERAGTGRATIVSTLAVLQGVMKRAVRDCKLPGNPVKQIDKPSQQCERAPVLVTVEQVEAMRLSCLGRDDLRSATLISLLAYAGPRPESEALPLRRSAVRRRTILFRASKRSVPHERATRLLAPLAGDLRTWRQACGRPPDDTPVIPSGRGGPWADYDWDNWRSRTFRAAAKAAGLRADPSDGARRARPRDLRSSFATLLIYEASRRSTSPSSSATARPRCCATTRASGRTSTRRSASDRARPQPAARRRSGRGRGAQHSPCPLGLPERTPCSAGVPRHFGRVRCRERQNRRLTGVS